MGNIASRITRGAVLGYHQKSEEIDVQRLENLLNASDEPLDSLYNLIYGGMLDRPWIFLNERHLELSTKILQAVEEKRLKCSLPFMGEMFGVGMTLSPYNGWELRCGGVDKNMVLDYLRICINILRRHCARIDVYSKKYINEVTYNYIVCDVDCRAAFEHVVVDSEDEDVGYSEDDSSNVDVNIQIIRMYIAAVSMVGSDVMVKFAGAR